MHDPLTVTQLVMAVNVALEGLGPIIVEGEVDEYKLIHGKWVTFRLKDAQSSVGCFMPVWQLRTQIEDGMLVRAVGEPKLRDKGYFSFVLRQVAPAGEGALRRAFQLLQEKLAAEGLFSPERKRPLPRFPEHIALITSRDAAAYSDFVKIVAARQGGLTISFIHTQVQGDPAPAMIAEAITTANAELKDLDAIVLVRGGGSLEDLQAFNDEGVVRAVAASRTPIIVGVGHERDVTLAELAADVRASTPSNAGELLVRSRDELLMEVSGLADHLRTQVRENMRRHGDAVLRSVHSLQARIHGIISQVTRSIDSLHGTGRRLRSTTEHNRSRIIQLERMLQSLSPEYTLRRGYSISRALDGTILKDAGALTRDQTIETTLHKGKFTSKIT